MGRKFKRVLFVSYAAAFFLFFGFQYFMKAALGEVERYTALLSYDHEIVVVMQDILMSLQQAESSRRGYILTKDRNFIQDYNSAVQSVQQSVLSLKQLNVKGSYRDAFLDSLGASINDRVKLIKSSIDLALENNLSDSVQAVFTDKGKELMGSIRRTILALMKERRNSRDDNYRALEQINAEIDALTEIAVVVVVIFGCGLSVATYFYFKKLDTVEAQLRQDVFWARQQAQHAMSRYQDLKVELKEKLDSSEGGEAKNS